jgi:hypothetical protein
MNRRGSNDTAKRPIYDCPGTNRAQDQPRESAASMQTQNLPDDGFSVAILPLDLSMDFLFAKETTPPAVH